MSTNNRTLQISRESKKKKWLKTWFTLNINAHITLDEFELLNYEFL